MVIQKAQERQNRRHVDEKPVFPGLGSSSTHDPGQVQSSPWLFIQRPPGSGIGLMSEMLSLALRRAF